MNHSTPVQPNAVALLRQLALEYLNHQISDLQFDLKKAKEMNDLDEAMMCESHIDRLKDQYIALERAFVPIC